MVDKSITSRLQLRHFHAFVAVCEERHVGRAAARLHLTQPAVSKTLAELEDIVGTRLLDRGRRGAATTANGEEFLPYAVAVLEALGRAGGVVGTRQRAAVETVRLGALPTVTPDLLPAALEQFRLRRPHARVTLQTASNAPLLHQLTTGAVDLVLGRMSDPSAMTGLTFEWLYVEPLAIAVRPGHPLVEEPLASIARVLDYALVVATPGTVPRHMTESYLRAQGAELPPNCLETMDLSLARLLVQRSDAVWFAPAGAVREDVARGQLHRLNVTTSGTEEPVGLLRRREGTLNAATLELVQVLRAAAAERH